MSDPEDHAHPRMWRPCLPDGEMYPPRPPASAESDAERAEGGISVRTYTENFCCLHPDEAREAMGRYQGTHPHLCARMWCEQHKVVWCKAWPRHVWSVCEG